jgi:alpha-mannosidase
MIQLDIGMMLKRARRFVEEVVRPAIYTDYTEVETGVYQCDEPISYDEAVRQEYKPVKPGFLWGPFWSTAWFKVNGKVPVAFKGRNFRLRFDTRTEALCWWKGVPYQGLELHRQDVELPDEVAAGRDFTVYIEAACNHMLGVGPQYGDPDRLGNMREMGGGLLKEVNIAVYHAECDRLTICLDTMIDLLQNLKQDSSNARFISDLLRKACNGIDKDDLLEEPVAGAKRMKRGKLKRNLRKFEVLSIKVTGE